MCSIGAFTWQSQTPKQVSDHGFELNEISHGWYIWGISSVRRRAWIFAIGTWPFTSIGSLLLRCAYHICQAVTKKKCTCLQVVFPQQIPPTDKTRIQLVQYHTVQELPQLPGISPFVEVPTPKSLDPQDPFLPSSDPDEMLDMLPDFIKESATERAFFIALHDQWYKINKFYAFQEGFFINEVRLNIFGPKFQNLLILRVCCYRRHFFSVSPSYIRCIYALPFAVKSHHSIRQWSLSYWTSRSSLRWHTEWQRSGHFEAGVTGLL